MKKLLALIILSVALASCYDNYITDFTYTSIYFSYQMDVRTVVVGEGMKFEVGAALGGVRENSRNRNVSYVLLDELISTQQLALMKAASYPYIKSGTVLVKTLNKLPANYYTISDPGTMVIKAGQHMGSVIIRPDSVTFLNDSVKTLNAAYALPFKIMQADADSMPFLKRTNVVGVRFENMLFGNYWHGGAALINRPGNVDTTIYYRSAVNDPATKIWTLTTAGPNTLFANGYFNQTTARNELKLVLKGNNIYISAVPAIVANAASDPEVLAKLGSTYPFVADGVGTFNRSKLLQDRKIFLKYSYTVPGVGGFTYHCTDTLIFRNRIRDGVNEWQDENPSHYTK